MTDVGTAVGDIVGAVAGDLVGDIVVAVAGALVGDIEGAGVGAGVGAATMGAAVDTGMMPLVGAAVGADDVCFDSRSPMMAGGSGDPGTLDNVTEID